MLKRVPIRCCSVLIQNPETGLFLGVTRKNDHNDWGIPGGKKEPGETDEQCAIRECLEETGIKALGLIKIYEDLNYVSPRSQEIYEAITFLVTHYDGKIHTSEAGLVDWVSAEKITSGSYGDYNAKLLEIYENNF